jgi:hypothetical protein
MIIVINNVVTKLNKVSNLSEMKKLFKKTFHRLKPRTLLR